MTSLSVPRSAVPGIAWPALPSDSGTIMLALLAQLNETQWWPAGLLRKMQATQLAGLLRHAAESTDYYSDNLPRSVLRKERPGPEDWLEIPTLGRTTVRDQFEALQSRAPPQAHGPTNVAVTSGSTGRPVRVVHTALSAAYEGAALLRYHEWHERDFQARLASIKHNHLPTAGKEDFYQSNWGWPVSHVYPSGQVAALTLASTVSQQAAWLQRVKPDYLLSLPSNLTYLIKYFRDHGLAAPGIRSVSTIMEVVQPNLRALCRDVWGASIVDSYSCRETGTLAVQCPLHEHYHVVPENNLVEVLRDDGTPCGSGESGRVVVTDLHNFAMPLIRYELGDYAELGDPCDCGRGLPVITRIHGRYRNMMLLPDGDRAWPHMARTTLMQLDYIRQYRFVQTARDTIEAHLVVTRPLSTEEERYLVNTWHKRWPYPFKVVFKYPETITIPAKQAIARTYRKEVSSLFFHQDRKITTMAIRLIVAELHRSAMSVGDAIVYHSYCTLGAFLLINRIW